MFAAVLICAVLLLVSVLYSFGFVACLIPLLIWIVSQRQSAGSVDPSGRAVLITGCDTGFGYLLAKQLDQLGFHVFAGCLFPDGEGAQTLKKECSSELNILKLDVTLDEDVAKAKEFVEANLPDKDLWGLVNNAGISTWGEVEWNNIQAYQRLADVNLWGSIRMAIAFIPLLRQSKGRLVFMSSSNAFIHLGGVSNYLISKCGIEVFSDCLRIEMKTFGVKVSIIEPGNYARATNILQVLTAEEVWNKLNDSLRSVYSKEYIQFYIDKIQEVYNASPQSPMAVINTIIDALISPNPKARYLIVSMVEWVLIFMCVHFPTWFVDALFIYIQRKALITSRINN
ncbi:D-beta-hydroxybutyrate dehydrogenase, mitochondrial [Heptranchias perlo]|uniref:D-beta-hydroxybutyrate dehydrogenase, mitochondrial n=1 Tax=Heptranchias perlo TaxID=212740 RepID=UPI00355A1316